MKKKTLHLLMTIFPVWFTVTFIVSRSSNVYVQELSIRWSYYDTVQFVVAVMMLWFGVLPFRKYFNGGLPHFFYGIFPLECFLLVVFAEYHFTMAVIVAAATVAVLIWGCCRWHRVLRTEDDRKIRRREKTYILRLSVTFAGMILLLPALTAFFQYHLALPVYEPGQQVQEYEGSAGNTDGGKVTLEYLLSQDPELVEQLHEEEWAGLNLQEKLDALNKFALMEGQLLGIPSDYLHLKSSKLGPYVLGTSIMETGEQIIDVEHMTTSPVSDCLDTIAHEVFHCLQKYTIDTINWDEEYANNSYYYKNAKEWKYNMENYIDGYDEGYWDQLLEKNAREYAEEEAAKCMEFVNMH